jgi:hypothetical protein
VLGRRGSVGPGLKKLIPVYYAWGASNKFGPPLHGRFGQTFGPPPVGWATTQKTSSGVTLIGLIALHGPMEKKCKNKKNVIWGSVGRNQASVGPALVGWAKCWAGAADGWAKCWAGVGWLGHVQGQRRLFGPSVPPALTFFGMLTLWRCYNFLRMLLKFVGMLAKLLGHRQLVGPSVGPVLVG